MAEQQIYKRKKDYNVAKEILDYKHVYQVSSQMVLFSHNIVYLSTHRSNLQ